MSVFISQSGRLKFYL